MMLKRSLLRGLSTLSEVQKAVRPVEKKRKRVVLFGYDGSPFNGSQTQRHEREVDMPIETVEDALHLALYKSGAITPQNFASLHKIGWTRSSRTDRGVHAATQLVCAKLIIPDYNELAETGDVSRQDESLFCAKVNSHLPPAVRVYRIQRVEQGFNARHCTDSRRYSYFLPEFALNKNSGSVEQVQRLLDCFVGTHSFHNFTENMLPMNPHAIRYITSFTAEQYSPGVIHLQVCGQSFLKHHIRRMVGFVVACIRNGHGPEMIATALQTDKICPQMQINMPFAPAEPLFLNMMYLNQHNAVTAREHIDFNEDSVRVQKDRMIRDVILPTVFSNYEAAFKAWLTSPNLMAFPPEFVTPDVNELKLREATRKENVKVYVRPR